MIEAGVGELKAHYPATEELGDLRMRGLVAAPGVARKDDAVPDERIPFAFEIVARCESFITVRNEPRAKVFGFAVALRLPKARQRDLAVDSETSVRGEHHVGQVRDGLDQLHVPAKFTIGGMQALPLTP